jgi:hypothetical protein
MTITLDQLLPVFGKNRADDLRMMIAEGPELVPSLLVDLGDRRVACCHHGFGGRVGWALYDVPDDGMVTERVVEDDPVREFLQGIDYTVLQVQMDTGQVIKIMDVDPGDFDGNQRIAIELREWLLRLEGKMPDDCRLLKEWLQEGRA